MRESQLCDSELHVLLRYLGDGVLPEDDRAARKVVLESKQLDVVDGVLYREDTLHPGQLCIVVPVRLRQSMLQEAHQGRFAGHLAASKVFSRLRHQVWWKGMRNDVHQFCKACLVCSSRKGGRRTFRPPLQPIPVGGPFHRVGMDVLQLPLTEKGNKYVVVFVDYFTKWPEAFPVPDQTAETIARLFVEQIVCRHGIPEELLSDRGAVLACTRNLQSVRSQEDQYIWVPPSNRWVS